MKLSNKAMKNQDENKSRNYSLVTLESLEKNHDFMILSISSRTWNVLVNIDTNLVF